MPEGPEVTIIRENLNTYLKGYYLVDMKIYPNSRYRNKAPDNYLNITKSIPLKLETIVSKGKLIYWLFEKNFSMLNTLGMSGIWSKNPYKHTSIEMNFILEGKKRTVYFIDTRHFGTLKFLTSKKELNDKLKLIGPDILNDKSITFDLYKKRYLKYKHYNITKAMMNQKIISGIGNYLKSEILYDAKISPLHKIEDLTEEVLHRLFLSSKKIIEKSYKKGGLSIRDYMDMERKKGDYGFELKVYCQDYDRFNNKVKRITTPDNRTTYWVPTVQK